jgi:stage II sporulation protein D
MISLPLRFRCGKPLAMVLFISLLIIWQPRGSAATPQIQPLDSAAFQNGWPVQDSGWHSVVGLYKNGELEALAKLLTGLAAEADSSLRLLALRNLAVVYKDLGQWSLVVDTYLEAVELAGSDGELWYDLGWALYALARYPAAAAAFEQSLAMAPMQPQTLVALGAALGEYAPDRALTHLLQAISLDPGHAIAYYELGIVYDRLGRTAEAVDAFETALRRDGGLTRLHPYLARVYEAQGDLRKAWSAYQKTSLVRTYDKQVAEDMARFVASKEAFLRQMEELEAKDRASLQLRQVTPVFSPDAPQIRVGLAEEAETIRLAWSGPVELLRWGRVVARLQPGGIWLLTRKGDVLSLRSEDGRTEVSGKAPWQLVPEKPTSTIAVYDMEMGKGYFYARKEHRQYRGSMEALVREGGITLVNIVDMESYLLSVVPSEMFTSMPLEALKAQAIAARTYTYRSLGRYWQRGFDVQGSVASSEYRGVGVEHANTTAAVLETLGLVLRDGDRPAQVFYNATAGGHTASSEEVWGGKISYLQPIVDTLDPSPPEFPLGPLALEAWIKKAPRVFASDSSYTTRSSFRWVLPVPAAEIEARVNARQAIGTVLAIRPGRRAVGGQVLEVEVVGSRGTHVVKGDSIRSMLGGLKSNLFKVESHLDADGRVREFVFYGGGFGHGVGLDQLGAAGMAEQGYDVAAILAHYYGSVKVHKLY